MYNITFNDYKNLVLKILSNKERYSLQECFEAEEFKKEFLNNYNLKINNKKNVKTAERNLKKSLKFVRNCTNNIV